MVLISVFQSEPLKLMYFGMRQTKRAYFMLSAATVLNRTIILVKVCPFCFSTSINFLKASGRANIYAFSLFNKGRPPYISAWVMLEEGVAIITNIIDCESDLLKIGTPIKVVFSSVEGGQKIPVFTPRLDENFIK